MPGVFVGTYSLLLRERSSDHRLNFDVLARKGKSASALVAADLARLKVTPWKNDGEKQVLRVLDVQHDETDVWGLLQQGDFGFTADLIDAITYKPSYVRRANDVELLPLYFRMHLPPDSSFGLLLMQRLGVHGAFTNFRAWLHDTTMRRFPDHILGIGSVLPTRLADELNEGLLREVTVVLHSVPRDLADRVNLGGAKQTIGKVELRIRAKRDETLLSGWIGRLRNNPNTMAELFGPGATNVRARLDYRGRQRTYDFNRANPLTPHVDVTRDVTIAKNGHPTVESVDAVCRQLRDELLEERTGGR